MVSVCLPLGKRAGEREKERACVLCVCAREDGGGRDFSVYV